MAEIAVTAAVAFATVVGLGLAAVTFVAWRRDRRPRFLLLALAFMLAAVKGAYLSWGLWRGDGALGLLAASAVADAAFLAAVYVALVKR